MIDIDFINIKKVIDNSIPELSINKKILSASVGMAIGRLNQLPSSEVTSINEHYYTIVRSITENKAYYFNEQIVIDLQYTLDIAKSYYITRYNTTYPKFEVPLLCSGTKYDIYSILSGVDQYVSESDYDLFNSNSKVIITLINLCINVLNKKEMY